MATGPGTYQNKMTEEKARINEFYLEVVLGRIKGYDYIHKYGRNDTTSTTPEPISREGIYRMPTTAANLEVLSDDANDTFLGSGARQVSIQGLDADWNDQIEIVNLNGLTPVALTKTFTRVFRLKVLNCGTYPSQTVWSQAGTLTLREAGGGQTWTTIGEEATNKGLGQSQIGCFTVPKGKTVVMLGADFSIDSTNELTVTLMQRRNCNNVTAPFDSFRVLWEHDGVSKSAMIRTAMPFYTFPQYTDLVFMCFGANNATATVDFEMLVIDNSVFRPDQLEFTKNH